MDKGLVQYLKQFITEQRWKSFEVVLEERTRYLTVVLEDLYQPHNASAILRSCDCFGIQDVHIIENRNEYDLNPDVALGSNQWLSLYKYNRESQNTLSTIHYLKSKGYRIVATTPHEKSVVPETFDLSEGKAALLFGTELEGLTDTALEAADEHLGIPMVGFSESLNISVSVAVILSHLSRRLRFSDIHWRLSEEEKLQIKEEWLMKSIKKPDLLKKEYLKNNNLKNK